MNVLFLCYFALISYVAMIFFTIGFGFAANQNNNLNMVKLCSLFILVAIFLSIPLHQESIQNKLIISLIWASVLWNGFRFGRKVIERTSDLS